VAQLGYAVAAYEPTSGAEDYYAKLVSNPADRRADMSIDQLLQTNDMGSVYAAHVAGDASVLDDGVHDIECESTLYISRSSIERFPGYPINSWRAFVGGPNVLHQQPLDGHATVMQAVISESWATYDILRHYPGTGYNYLLEDPTSPNTSRAACYQNDMTLLDGEPLKTGCIDPNWPSMYVPPQCYPNPRAQCGILWAPQPVST